MRASEQQSGGDKLVYGWLGKSMARCVLFLEEIPVLSLLFLKLARYGSTSTWSKSLPSLVFVSELTEYA
jgi:hypothetical protein